MASAGTSRALSRYVFSYVFGWRHEKQRRTVREVLCVRPQARIHVEELGEQLDRTFGADVEALHERRHERHQKLRRAVNRASTAAR